jgi:hypothetical protein
MIGGIDIQLPTRAGDSAVEVAVRAVRQHWPHAVFENGDTGDRYDHFWQIPFGKLDEIFVYRDSEAADGWDADGAIPALYNTMVHILADEGMITVVIDERTAAMDGLVAAVFSALSDEALYVPATVEAV